MSKRVLLFCGIALTSALLWFAVSNYRGAFPLAEENLRGLALSITAAVENIASHDPSFRSLNALRFSDLAYFAIEDKTGTFVFHSNPDLIGTSSGDSRNPAVVENGTSFAGRIRLGTGEKAYEFLTPVHLSDSTLVLRLTLHTYRSDTVIRKAKLNMLIILALLIASWILSATIYRFALREERHKMVMMQQESLARLGEMGATLAHEIRNPLGGIKGFAQLIERKPLDERNSGFAGKIITETVRLENLVTSLLSYARTETWNPALFRLNEVITHSVSLVQPEAQLHNISVTTDCSEGIQLRGDRERFAQLLLNLAGNAIQSMQNGGGKLHIAAVESGKSITVTVADTGHGIAEKDMKNIFLPFFTTRERGTGLGLALCRKIIEAHQGTIEIHSTVDQGTTVTLTIPAR